MLLTGAAIAKQGIGLLARWVLEFAPLIAMAVKQQRHQTLQAKTERQSAEPLETIVRAIDVSCETLDWISAFRQEKSLQQEFATSSRAELFQLAAQQREITLKLPEIGKILENWPLKLYPSQLLDSHANPSAIPLRVILAPPHIRSEVSASGDGLWPILHRSRCANGDHRPISALEPSLAQELRNFLSQHYSLHSSVRPTEFLAGAWESKRFHSEASIKALFSILKSQPTLILESEIDGDYLNFRIAYWGFGQSTYYYQTIAKIGYRDILVESAKTRAREWKATRERLLALGEDRATVDRLGGERSINLNILEKAEQWKREGVDIERLTLDYQIGTEDFDQLARYLADCHSLVAGWVADAYHLIYRDVLPVLPELLPDLLKDDADPQLIQAIISGYEQLYRALEGERRYWAPELALQLARSLTHLPERAWAAQHIDYSVRAWLELRQISNLGSENPLEQMESAVTIADWEYVEQLRASFVALGDERSIAQTQALLDAIAIGRYTTGVAARSCNVPAKETETIALGQSETFTDFDRPLNFPSAAVDRTFVGHAKPITSIAMSPDGQVFASGSLDKTIKLWNVSTGELMRTLMGHSGGVSSVAIDAGGKLLVSGSDNYPRHNLKVWDLHKGKRHSTWFGHKQPVKVVATDPQGKIFVSGSNKIKVWEIKTGKRLCTLWHTCSVNTAAISPNGCLLVSGSSDSKIVLWNLRTGELLRTIAGHTSSVNAVAISPDGEMLLSASSDTTMKLWCLKTYKLLRTFTGHAEEVNSLALCPRGLTAFTGSSDRSIRLWNVRTGKLLHILSGHEGGVCALAIAPDGRTLISGSADTTIRLWRLG